MKRLFVFISGLLLLTAALGFGQWSDPVNVSRIERISGAIKAWYPSLTVDSSGTLHASWSVTVTDPFDWIDYACKPAAADTWTTPVHVSRDTYPLRGSVVVIGPGGVPHIVWQSEARAGDLYITRKDGDTWTLPQRLEGWNRMGSGIRAAADRFGRIHVVWWDLTYDYIWYARYGENGWFGPEAVAFDTTPWALGGPSVVADRNGRPHIIYGWLYDFVYSFRTDTGWTAPVRIPSISERPSRAGITLDTCDHPHVVIDEYYIVSHTYWTGDPWATPVRLDSVESAFSPSICRDSWNRIHVFLVMVTPSIPHG